MSADDLYFLKLLDMDFDRDADGGSAVSLQIAPKHRQANGVVHGSVVHALLDTSMGIEAFRAADRSPVATAEISVRFLAPSFEGTLSSQSRVIKAGKRTIVLDGEVKCDGKLVAVGQSTYMRISR